MSTSDEFNIKHRLTGAAILITLGVIILPMLLGSYSQSDNSSEELDRTINKAAQIKPNSSFKDIEEKDIKVFVSKIRPAGSKSEDEILREQLAEAINKPLIQRKKTDAVDNEKTTSKSAVITPKVVKPKVVKSIPVKSPSASSSVKSIVTEGYIVSVGVYSKSENAENVMRRLVDSGFKPTKRVVPTSKGQLPRVWLGPFTTRAEAGKQKLLLQNRLGELGARTLIKRYP